MIRLFVAIELPGEVRDRLAMLGAGVENARWVPPENLHLSLRFIGEVHEPVVEDIIPALSRIRMKPFALTLSGAGHFESGKRVRALWVGVEKSPPLIDLQDRIEAGLARAGIPRDGRRFTPHITLARLKNGAPGAVRNWLANSTLFRSVPFEVARFVLFSSHLGRSGSHYRHEHVFRFADGRRPENASAEAWGDQPDY